MKIILLSIFAVAALAVGASAQKTKPAVKTPAPALPKVTQVDEAGLKNAIKTAGRPKLVNFWATWCDPCREEFPDLVKLDEDYKGRVDVVTVSLDDLAEIDRDVPKFLAGMNAKMPSYLLKVADEGVVIGAITKDWQGGLPFTIIYGANGEIAYFRQGKFKPETVRAELDKATAAAASALEAK